MRNAQGDLPVARARLALFTMNFITPTELARKMDDGDDCRLCEMDDLKPGQAENGHRLYVFEDLPRSAQDRVIKASCVGDHFSFSWPFYVYDRRGHVLVSDAGAVMKLKSP